MHTFLISGGAKPRHQPPHRKAGIHMVFVQTGTSVRAVPSLQNPALLGLLLRTTPCKPVFTNAASMLLLSSVINIIKGTGVCLFFIQWSCFGSTLVLCQFSLHSLAIGHASTAQWSCLNRTSLTRDRAGSRSRDGAALSAQSCA